MNYNTFVIVINAAALIVPPEKRGAGVIGKLNMDFLLSLYSSFVANSSV